MNEKYLLFSQNCLELSRKRKKVEKEARSYGLPFSISGYLAPVDDSHVLRCHVITLAHHVRRS